MTIQVIFLILFSFYYPGSNGLTLVSTFAAERAAQRQSRLTGWHMASFLISITHFKLDSTSDESGGYLTSRAAEWNISIRKGLGKMCIIRFNLPIMLMDSGFFFQTDKIVMTIVFFSS